MNKRGNFMSGVLIGIMALFMFLALTPAIVSMFGTSKGSDSANCPGYTDPNAASLGANNKSYASWLDTNTLSCTVLDFGPGLVILGVVFAVIVGIITGSMGQPQQQNPYQYG